MTRVLSAENKYIHCSLHKHLHKDACAARAEGVGRLMTKWEDRNRNGSPLAGTQCHGLPCLRQTHGRSQPLTQRPTTLLKIGPPSPAAVDCHSARARVRGDGGSVKAATGRGRRVL